MKLNKNAIYKFNVFREYLKEKGLPNSRPTIIRYENEGVIPEARRTETNDPYRKGERIYTAREIRGNTRLIKKHKERN